MLSLFVLPDQGMAVGMEKTLIDCARHSNRRKQLFLFRHRRGGWMEAITFENRVAIVTGAGEGIGREYALDLAKRGAQVVVNDIGHGPDQVRTADKVVDEIKKSGGKAVASFDSVATMKGGKNIVDTAMDHFGKVDILINNAGILRDRTFMKMTEKDWNDPGCFPR
ncbi:MAG: SDR family NAD(P)-dependent oxidoreductase [Desulfobacula sp.]|nr:SDR family NAD(P)-dependent oxidoreductase [Desulfobacula sp.]